MKADMEAMKDQMTSMMEGMMSMGRMKEDNTVAVATTEANPTHPSGINQTSRLALDMVGQGA